MREHKSIRLYLRLYAFLFVYMYVSTYVYERKYVLAMYVSVCMNVYRMYVCIYVRYVSAYVLMNTFYEYSMCINLYLYVCVCML